MSITVSLKSIIGSMFGSVFRNTLMTDMTTIENEANRVAAIVKPTSIVLGAVERNTWPAAGSATVALTDVFANGQIGNLPAGNPDAGINTNAGVMLHRFKANGAIEVTADPVLNMDVATKQWVEARVGDYSLDSGAANAYVIALNPAIAAYTGNFSGSFKVANANTGNSTLNTGGGVVPLVSDVGGQLSNGDLVVGTIVTYQYILADNKAYITSFVTPQAISQAAADLRYIALSNSMLFEKAASVLPCFTKTAASSLSILAGTRFVVAGILVSFANDTAVVLPALSAGTNYAVYVCTDGTIRADISFVAPTGYTTANSRQVGGFHYGLIAPATTLAGGLFNTAGSPVGGGMVWIQSNVDDIAGINKFSIWDLRFRPASDPRGMVLVSGRTWVDIYLCSTDTEANGTSKYSTNIASGTVLPKVPTAFGGNGILTYSTLTWWEASELARANKKRLLLASEFYDAAFGVTENQSIDATVATYPTTLRNAGYTSKYGIEQASGHHYTWGVDSGGSATAWVANGGRGQSYNNSVARVLLGGSRSNGANSGSRCSYWGNGASNSIWSIGLRAACDHLQLA
jgi:hypothetical protein